MTGPGRPRKRQRSNVREHVQPQTRTPSWTKSLDSLIERLETTKTGTCVLRDEEVSYAADITDKIAAKHAATKAVSKVNAPPPSEDVDAFSRGVRVEAERPRPDIPKVPPLPAMKLLMEQDPPEKLIHEQSVIVRAQAINRKNAELARERLPKQPEAQRNKTFHDYFLDEALWMAADFREERKWKVQMAKKVSKMIQQYHTQKAQREARAKAEAQLKIVKLARSMARDVRKFWSQIGEIADYRNSLLEEAKAAKQKSFKLKSLLETTVQYSNAIASRLQSSQNAPLSHIGHAPKQVTFAPHGTQNGVRSSQHHTDDASDENSISSSPPSETNDCVVSSDDDSDMNHGSQEFKEDSDDGDGDDESTLIAAEAEDADDDCEVQNLQAEANMSVGDLLRLQGIDHSTYQADQTQYLDSDDDEFGSSRESIDYDEIDDESTIQAAEKEETRDSMEIENLQNECELSIEDLLISQGIDPQVYIADTRPSGRENSASNEDADESAEEIAGRKPPNSANVVRNDLPSTTIHCIGEKSIIPEEHVMTDKTVEAGPRAIPTGPSGEIARLQPSSLLRGTLREYQLRGMDWLVSLYNENLNGILADEMGLGKTMQTIALLAWLATEKGVWGPHLVVVPTSVMVNWEVEFKKWLPGFKVLNYFGSVKERKAKRKGWTQPNMFHVCITSYNLALQDATALRRKKWVYLILDEAHNIKNFESQRWQTLLSFSAQRRLLITGTPLQNSVMELWSLMHFLMPTIFSSQSEFKHWFSNPLLDSSDAHNPDHSEKLKTVSQLHEVLRPFVLRRLKADVEKGLPPKYEHVVSCPLSKRQRQLYEDFMARSDIRDTLEGGDFFSVMNILMQLRKVCNHPDLFEGRQISSPFSMQSVFYPVPTGITQIFAMRPEKSISLDLLGLDLCSFEMRWPGRWHVTEGLKISAADCIRQELRQLGGDDDACGEKVRHDVALHPSKAASCRALSFRQSQLRYRAQRTAMRLRQKALFGEDLRSACTMTTKSLSESLRPQSSVSFPLLQTGTSKLVRSVEDFSFEGEAICKRFVCCIARVTAPVVELRFRGDDRLYNFVERLAEIFEQVSSPYQALWRAAAIRSRVTIPDTRLIQWDCGKLQVLDQLLRKLRKGGSRVLIFTQMTKVLDILESFLNLHSHRYLRLDGTTKTEQRQKVVERFNTDDRVFCMILTTRAGGIGLNLTGADSVIFYDTDYNPAIDSQAQDRAHRIGQTKPVHIYRLVSEQTVEENILKRANEKRTLESLVITEAGFTTEAMRDRGLTKAPYKPGEPNGRSVLQDLAPSEIVAKDRKNGLSDDVVTEEPLSQQPVAQPNGSMLKPNQPAQAASGALSVETAYGAFTGFSINPQGLESGNNLSLESSAYLQFQDVTAKLLVAEDDREQIAIHTAEEEQRELRAEFEETLPSPEALVDAEDLGLRSRLSVVDGQSLESSLSPVQRYALRLVESYRTISDNDELADVTDLDRELTLDKMLERRQSTIDVAKCSDGVVVAADFKHSDTFPDDDGDPLVYNMDISAEGQMSSLKALTDTDVDIKLYLPLRDGGPEELKISSVVSGTAAAGLECAEDAAFFPHAYNRMSRTIYSTHRQKEKAKANFKKRRAEREVRRRRDSGDSDHNSSDKRGKLDGTEQGAKQIANAEKCKAPKSKSDLSCGPGPTPTRKIRVESGSKVKVVGAGASSNAGGESQGTASTGLFRKTSKKTPRRLLSAVGKTAGGGPIVGTPGEGIGLNDQWTRDEDRQVISFAAEFNNNMLLTADVLSLDPSVFAGIRRSRGQKHCLERLLTCVPKETKTGPPQPKATISDNDVFQKHRGALSVASKVTREAKPPWLFLPTIPTPLHPSQTKVMSNALSKTAGRFRGDLPPTYTSVAASIRLPPHFKAGLKPTETTTQALQRKRYPFLRPSREDGRNSSQKSGSSSRQSGPLTGIASLAAATSSLSRGSGVTSTAIGSGKPPKSQSQAPFPRPGSGVLRASIGSSSKMKVKGTESSMQGTQSGISRVSTSQMAAKPFSTVSRGIFVPGTGARMNICQVGGTVTKASRVATGIDVKPGLGRNSGIEKGLLGGSAVKSGKITVGSTRGGPAVEVGDGSGNGVKWNTGVKMATGSNAIGTAKTTNIARGESQKQNVTEADKPVMAAKASGGEGGGDAHEMPSQTSLKAKPIPTPSPTGKPEDSSSHKD